MAYNNNLTIASWNATGIMSSASYLSDFLDINSIDICGISEHWLYDYDLHFLNHINSKYHSHSISDPDLMIPSNRRVGKGGIGIMWHKRIDNIITHLDINSRYVIGIRVTITPEQYLYVFQIYLPCKTHSIWTYKNAIEDLENIICLYLGKGRLMVMGDFNTELPTRNQSGGTLDGRGNILAGLMMRHDLMAIHTLDICKGAEFTNVPFNTKRQTLIDHMLIPKNEIQNLHSCNIIEDNALNFSTHRPITCSLSIFTHERVGLHMQSHIIKWKNVKQKYIDKYTQYLESNHKLQSALNTNIQTKTDVDRLYQIIVQVINEATNECIPRTKFKPFIKPYWTKTLSVQHDLMKALRSVWINEGRPRGDWSPSYREYKNAKAAFKRLHREAVCDYMINLEKELDEAAELDNDEFWRLINRRKSKTRTGSMGEMIFKGTNCNKPKDIIAGWREYYTALYNTEQSETFDNEYHQKIKQELSEIISKLPEEAINSRLSIDEQLVKRAMHSCKKNKAAGQDNVCYESIMYGGHLLIKVLTKLYKCITELTHIPIDMKRGIIVPFFKGGNKNKCNPDSYRPISLCSTILKLYEKTLLYSQNDSPMFNISPLQGGFQKQVSCVMTSFMLRESIHFANENHSKVYACFLDTRKAYDTVDHTILMKKLYKSGINITIFKIILNMFKDVYSCVRVQGQTSDWFPILQGTRQGQSISPLLYILFINELVNTIEQSSDGLKINNISYSCPTSADDMVLVSLSKNGLGRLVDTCYLNSQKERYRYNSDKSNVVVFNENKHEMQTHSREWQIGPNTLKEVEQYTHLGIVCNKTLNAEVNIEEACSKLRKTFFGLADYKVYREGTHPITLKHLYKTIVLPRALYGCELWGTLSAAQLKPLERTHRQCIKYMQSLPRYTRTDIALSCIGMVPIEHEINKRKLQLFGQLCNLPNDNRIKILFTTRLMQFKLKPSNARGFMPDIYQLLGKYDLIDELNTYTNEGIFPSLKTWKMTIKYQINKRAEIECINRISSDQSTKLFLKIHNTITPCSIWYFGQQYRNYLPLCKTLMIIIGKMFSRPYTVICPECNLTTDNIVEHMILRCNTKEVERYRLWVKLHRLLGRENYDSMCELKPLEQVIEMLAGFPEMQLSDQARIDCFKVVARQMHSLCSDIITLFSRA